MQSFLVKFLSVFTLVTLLFANVPVSFAQVGDFIDEQAGEAEDYASGEGETAGEIFGFYSDLLGRALTNAQDIGNAIWQLTDDEYRESLFRGLADSVADAEQYVRSGSFANDVGTLAGEATEQALDDIWAALEPGFDCLFNVTLSNLPNLDPAQNRQRDLMIQQQVAVSEEYSIASIKVTQMDATDARLPDARAKLQIAADRTGEFMCLNVQQEMLERSGLFYESDNWNRVKDAALFAIANAKTATLAPYIAEGTVEGDIVQDFIPQFIRLLFGFASLAVFVAFVVAGLFFVTAFGNEERVTKAKEILNWTLVGFAVVVLAFAIVKAVTDIDFFGFI